MKFLVLFAILAFVCAASAMPPRKRNKSEYSSEQASASWEKVVEDMLKVADSEREKADRNMRVADYLKDWYDGLTVDMQRNQRLAYMISRTADAVEGRELTNGQVPLQVLEGTGYSASNDVTVKPVLAEDPTQIAEEVQPKNNLEALIQESNLNNDAKLFEETLVKSIIRDELQAISETELAQTMSKPFVDDVFLAMEHIVHAIELVESAKEVVESAKEVIAPAAEAVIPSIDVVVPVAEVIAMEAVEEVKEVVIPAFEVPAIEVVEQVQDVKASPAELVVPTLDVVVPASEPEVPVMDVIVPTKEEIVPAVDAAVQAMEVVAPVEEVVTLDTVQIIPAVDVIEVGEEATEVVNPSNLIIF